MHYFNVKEIDIKNITYKRFLLNSSIMENILKIKYNKKFTYFYIS